MRYYGEGKEVTRPPDRSRTASGLRRQRRRGYAVGDAWGTGMYEIDSYISSAVHALWAFKRSITAQTRHAYMLSIKQGFFCALRPLIKRYIRRERRSAGRRHWIFSCKFSASGVGLEILRLRQMNYTVDWQCTLFAPVASFAASCHARGMICQLPGLFTTPNNHDVREPTTVGGSAAMRWNMIS